MIISPNSTEESHDSSGMSCDLLGLGTLQLEDPLGYAWWILGHVTTIYWYNVQGEMSPLDEVRGETNESEGKEARERGREGERGVCFYCCNCTHTVHAFYRKCVQEIGVWFMICSADVLNSM